MAPGEPPPLDRDLLVRREVAQRDVQGAAAGHGVAGVDHQVEEDLVQLAGIAPDAAEARLDLPGQPDVLADQAVEHDRHVGEQLRQVDHLRLDLLAPAEQEELPRQLRAAQGRAVDLLDGLAERAVARQSAEQHLAVAADRAEQGVEVVRHAAGETADGLHLLRLAVLGLEQDAVREVAQRPQEEDLAAVADLAHREVHGERRAVAAPPLDLPADADDPRLAGLPVTVEIAVVLLAPGGRHEDLDVLSYQLLGGVAEQPLDGGVDRLDDAGGVDEHDPVDGGVEHRLQPLRALLERRLGPPLLGDVLHQTDVMGDPPVLVAERMGRQLPPEGRAVLADEALLDLIRVAPARGELVVELVVARQIVRVGEVEKGPLGKLRRGVSQHPLVGGVGLHDPPALRHRGDADADDRVVEDRPVALPALGATFQISLGIVGHLALGRSVQVTL